MVTEREWREAADLQPMRIWLLVVLAVAAALRFWHLGHGIPFGVGVDEPVVMQHVLAILRTGDYNPHFFHYPGLAFYLHVPVAILRFVTGALDGRWRSVDGMGIEDLYLWSRALTACLGTLTVLLVHQVGLRWGARHGLLAAGLMAVMPLHVRESHYALTDVPATFFVVLAWLASLVAHERARWGWFAMAGALAGLATSVKYTVGLALLLPLVAAWMTVPLRPSRLHAALAAAGGFAAAYLLTAPYTVLDLRGFLDSFGNLLQSFRPREPMLEAGWLVYLKHLRINLGWPAALLAAGGLALAVVRAVKGPGRVRWVLLVLFPAMLFASLARRHQIYARYLLPMVPFVCTLVAIAVVSGVSQLRRFDIPRLPRTMLIVALTVAAVLPPLLTSIGFVKMIGRPSTPQAAFDWISARVPPGSTVVIERNDLWLPEARYRSEHVVRLVDRPLDRYRHDGVRYLVATSAAYGAVLEDPSRDPELSSAYRTLFRQTRELARFSPSADRRGPELRILEIP
jgi:4-amino-4-deoxy-L-arabinose transferase-like glycosyltransferase